MTNNIKTKPKCKRLVLDAGPLLSLSPLRGLAETYLTVPQVLAELKDSRAREHFEKLGLMSGANVQVQSPDPVSLAHVIQWAKKTGDYSVLSHADLCVLALTYSLDKRDIEKTVPERKDSTQNDLSKSDSATYVEEITTVLEEVTLDAGEKSLLVNDEEPSSSPEIATENDLQSQDVDIHQVDSTSQPEPGSPLDEMFQEENLESAACFDDPSDSDDGEGEWITPENVALHKSRAMELLPNVGGTGKKGEEIDVGCMTADFAMQNVILQMGLNLVGIEGKRIQKVKTWVLRCHACFKICKDNARKFCPSCGSPTLLRASVTIKSPDAASDAPVMQVHLKHNFQYKLRGTKYSIPAPKPGSAKTGPGEGLILREDQSEYMRAKRLADGKREREEAKLLKGIFGKGVQSGGANALGSWQDPDWIPEMISVGSGGKGRTIRNSKMDGDLPQIGYGRKNPNERKRRK